MRNIVLTIIILCFAQSTFAQTNFREGYVITLEGDTLNGLVDYSEGSKNFKSCRFKTSNSKDVIEYSPDQIRGYRFSNDTYFEATEFSVDEGENNETVSNKVFFEVLIRGKVSLFKYLETYFVVKDTLLLELKNEQKEMKIEGKNVLKYTNQHVGILTYLLSDCVGINEKIKNVRVTERGLTNLIRKYNNCVGVLPIEYKEKKPWIKVTPSLVLGVNYSSLEFKIDKISPVDQHLLGKFDKSSTYIIGVNFAFASPRINENFAFQSGIYYMPTTYSSYYEYTRGIVIARRNDISIQLEQLMIPLGLEYTFTKNIISPYVNGGFTTTLNFNSSTNWIEEEERNNVVTTSEQPALTMGIKNTQFGIWVGFGLKKQIFNKLGSHLELRYNYTNGLIKDNGVIVYNGTSQYSSPTSRISNIQLLFGISF